MGIPVRNILRMTSASLARRTLGKRTPLNLMFAITDRCTGHCSYCKIPQRGSTEMTTAEILRMITEAAELGCQRLGIWGGEPLLRDDLGQIIAHAKGLGLFVTADTNGHLLPQRSHLLSGVDHINISLDGDREAHDANRGAGTFDRAMAGLNHAVGRFDFWTLTVMSKHNIDQVDWILDLARQMGFKANFQVLHHNDELGNNEGLYASEPEIREVARQLMRRKRHGAPLVSSEHYLRHLLDWPDYTVSRLPRFKDYPECLAGKLYCNVDVNGKMYPCSLFVDEIAAPDVRDAGFAAAFDALADTPCRACAAQCFTEYNNLYALDVGTGLNWVKALVR